ncbi:hypothetical protein ACHAW5_005064 [Stephanodiscus triporus]|uniref:Guanine nucleotide-binding protein subunit beta-like protein n=1 Tax=Stephanodiscus triporus TaxID=2934178 RepID=A0ABD3QND8_9STRA
MKKKDPVIRALPISSAHTTRTRREKNDTETGNGKEHIIASMSNDFGRDDDDNRRRRRMPSRLVVVAGTYDGVLAGWDTAAGVNDANDAKAGAAAEDEKEKKKRGVIEMMRPIRRGDNDGRHLKMTFAMAAHEGSVRCIDVASSSSSSSSSSYSSPAGDNEAKNRVVIGPGALLSGGHDESINVYDLRKRSQSGELRTPADLGTPLCCSFAPPSNHLVVVDDDDDASTAAAATHAVVGTSSGKIVIYRRRDWSVQHVLSGHDPNGGVVCIAVHPTGRMALSGGGGDGRLILWDLVKGRLAYVHKVRSSSRNNLGGRNNNGGGNNRRREAIEHVVWSGDGSRYAYCHGSKIVARDASTGEDLLDVDMSPCPRVNQLAFVGGPGGTFLAAACDDGGLPLLQVGELFDDDDDEASGGGREGEEEEEDAGRRTRRAIMAIEPEEGRNELNAEAIERARKLVGQAKEHQKRKKQKLSKKL